MIFDRSVSLWSRLDRVRILTGSSDGDGEPGTREFSPGVHQSRAWQLGPGNQGPSHHSSQEQSWLGGSGGHPSPWHLPRDGPRPGLDAGPWVGPAQWGSWPGCGEMETSPAVASLDQGLMAQHGVLGCGQGGGSPRRTGQGQARLAVPQGPDRFCDTCNPKSQIKSHFVKGLLVGVRHKSLWGRSWTLIETIHKY